ncbi:MAG: psrP [Candidatus Saganbacteria bacterium]|uniref:PsrP n=1 Tax=Candidatus Saganbacteria bacterium TaxID=2575572 RepID=A0A833L1U5_UNCSA|nr:MAG: psrP [Candidatus Saganbacteria bacterium]
MKNYPVSFPRRRESSEFRKKLDSRFHGNDFFRDFFIIPKMFYIAFATFLYLSIAANAAPIIAHEELTTLTDTTAIITWTTTNEAADTKVYLGVGAPDTSTAFYSSSDLVIYHYATLTGLTQGTTYTYYIKSGTASTSLSEKTFTTLTAPSGEELFTFASISDIQYAAVDAQHPTGKADTAGARGRPYSHSAEILDAMVTEINKYAPAFTVIRGDIIEKDYGDQIATQVKGKLDNLTKASDLNKYYPIPGNHDKESAYTAGDWVKSNLGLLYPPMISNSTAESSFNYSFIYNGYRFIMLDSVKTDYTANIKTSYLTAQLAEAQTAGQKCFIFLHHPATDVHSENLPADVISEITGGSSSYDSIQLMNTVEAQTIITTYKDIVAGVFSGHIHDNKYTTVSGVPYVRNSAGIQFPTSFNVYKVYSNGYMMSTYKVPTWTEVARNVITAEAGYSEIYWEQFSMGPSSARNFSYTLSANAPEVNVSKCYPTSNSTSVPLNNDIMIYFSKAMNTTDSQNAVTITPNPGGLSYRWENGNSVLYISHTNFSASTTYTVQVGVGAKDSSGTALSAAASYSFSTGASADTTAPAAAFDNLLNNVTTDNQQVITGIATDSASTIVSIECRVDGGSWTTTTALDGLLNSATEKFSWTPSLPLTRGVTSHEVEVRAKDSAGNINTTFTLYGFYVIGDRPEVALESRGTTIINGDTIDKDPSFSITIISDKPPVTATSYLNALSSSDITALAASITLTVDTNNPYIFTGAYTPTLTDGKYTIIIKATDNSGNVTSKEVSELSVQTQTDLKIQGTPLSYPNPFNPELVNAAIGYTLSKASNVSVTFHDLMGNQIAKKSYSSVVDGGKAGYNEISWNGRDDSNSLAGNGTYIYIISGDGKYLSKGKVTVLK